MAAVNMDKRIFGILKCSFLASAFEFWLQEIYIHTRRARASVRMPNDEPIIGSGVHVSSLIHYIANRMRSTIYTFVPAPPSCRCRSVRKESGRFNIYAAAIRNCWAKCEEKKSRKMTWMGQCTEAPRHRGTKRRNHIGALAHWRYTVKARAQAIFMSFSINKTLNLC